MWRLELAAEYRGAGLKRRMFLLWKLGSHESG